MRFLNLNLKLLPLLLFAFLVVGSAQMSERVILVSDNPSIPGAVATIQEAVSTATAGSRIIVLPGVYRGQVNIKGHDKDGLKLIAAGGPDEVILQGDHTQRDGFHLEDVNGVLIEGFTIRDFGEFPTTDKVTGVGNNIALLRANKNVIRSNTITRADMMGIDARDSSSDNIIEYNVSYNNDNFPKGSACGIMISGAGSTRNIVRYNEVYGNDLAGLMIRNSPNNVVVNNTFIGNGLWGIDNTNSNGTRIEGNRLQLQRGIFFGPSPRFYGIGINLQTSTGVVVKDNIASGNTAFDLYWDSQGDNAFGENGHIKPLKRLSLTNTTNPSRNPNFTVGDSFRLQVSDAPANVPVYMSIVKDGKFLGTSGPYGDRTDSQGRWSMSGIFPSEGVGSWLVQLQFGSPDSPQQSGTVAISIMIPGQAVIPEMEPHCVHDHH